MYDMISDKAILLDTGEPVLCQFLCIYSSLLVKP